MYIYNLKAYTYRQALELGGVYNNNTIIAWGLDYLSPLCYNGSKSINKKGNIMSYEINNKDGRVSAYGFACGYKETCEREHRFVEIYADGGIYHVRWWLGDSPIDGRYWETTDGGWEQFERLTDARKAFSIIARKVSKK